MSAPQLIDDAPRSVVVDRTPPHRGWFKRRRNRRVQFATTSVPVLLAGGASWIGRKLLVAGKVLVVIAVVGLSVLAGRQLVRQVIASPRFAVQEVRVTATTHVSAEEIQEVAGVEMAISC